MDRAVALVSGGLDSATSGMIAAQSYSVYALSFDYGQRHRLELSAAALVAEMIGAHEHKILRVPLDEFKGSALTDHTLALPRDRSADEMAQGIPITYVPGRNTVFLSFAVAWAEVLQARAIFIGVNVLDASGYPDCRPEFIGAYERVANLATRRGVEGQYLRIIAPLMHWTKAEIIQAGMELGVNYSLTTSCYDATPDGACGTCDTCQLRQKGFREAGLTDPIQYRA